MDQGNSKTKEQGKIENTMTTKIETDDAKLTRMVEALNRSLGTQGKASLIAGEDGVAMLRISASGIDLDFAPIYTEMVRGLRIAPWASRPYEVVRFALLPHLKPVLVRMQDGALRVVLASVEYLNADPKFGNYPKLPDGSYPPVRWRVGYVMLSLREFQELEALVQNQAVEALYNYDLGLFAWLPRDEGEVFVKNRKMPAWRRDPEVAKKVEEAAQRLAQDGGKLLIEQVRSMIGSPCSANLEEWDTLMARVKAWLGTPYSE
jgi:hypothetical protein